MPAKGWSEDDRSVRRGDVGEAASAEVRILHPEAEIPHNLPAPLSSFVGRARELAEVLGALAESRFLTLTGAGGCGKSRLALQVAADSLGSFPDGAWWLELAPITEPAMVAPAVAHVFGVRPLPGQSELDAAVSYLSSRRALVVLDNCEHVIDEAARVAETLGRGCPHVRVLATSREPLRAEGETEWRVPSMSLSKDDGYGAADAVALFVERAAQVKKGFALSGDNTSAVVRICRELDGIPLAIELAAARLRVLSVEQIADWLHDRFRLLKGGVRTALERHQTLRASVEWSHDLLSGEEQVLFRRLGVFVGGFTLEAAAGICGGDGIERDRVLDLLAALVDKSLVLAEEHQQEVRYRMLETVRQYALECLEEAEEDEVQLNRHRDFYLEFAERMGSEILTPRQPEVLDVLDPDWANFSQAIEQSVVTEPEKALRFCVALTWWYRLRGHFPQGETAFSKALQAAGEEPSILRARAMWGRAHLLTYAGAFGEAIPAAHEALAEAERAEDDVALTGSLFVLGALIMYPDPIGARPLLERGRRIAMEGGDDFWLMAITQMLAYTYINQLDYATAIPLLEEVLPIAERIGYLECIAWHWVGVGGAAWRLADQAAGRKAVQAALSAARTVDDVVTEIAAVALLGLFDIDTGDPESALSLFAPVRERGVLRGSAFMLSWLEVWIALAYAAAGRLEEARSKFEAVIAVGAGGTNLGLSWALTGLAEVLRLRGDAAGADEAASRSLEVAEGVKSRAAAGEARLVLGRLSAGRGEWADAQRLHHEALADLVEIGHTRDLPPALEALAEVAAGLESYAEAAHILGAAERARDELGLVAWNHQREENEALVARVRDALDEQAFEQAWAEGEALTANEAVAYVRRARGERRRPSAGWESLTPTELEVAHHTSAGLTNAQIGERMFISQGTVRNHLSHVYAKLGIKNRSELAVEASRRARTAES